MGNTNQKQTQQQQQPASTTAQQQQPAFNETFVLRNNAEAPVESRCADSSLVTNYNSGSFFQSAVSTTTQDAVETDGKSQGKPSHEGTTTNANNASSPPAASTATAEPQQQQQQQEQSQQPTGQQKPLTLTAEQVAEQLGPELIPGYATLVIRPRDYSPPSLHLVKKHKLHDADKKQLFDYYGILGTGGFGAVYKCKRLSDGKTVAIKAIEKHINFSTSSGQRQLREFDLARTLRIDHPNLVEFYDYYFDADYKGPDFRGPETVNRLAKRQCHFIVMEYIKDGDLQEEILKSSYKPLKDPCLAPADALKYFTQLVLGIKALHQRGLAHRDLKPQNVLISIDEKTGEKTLKIVDFGLTGVFRDENGNEEGRRSQVGTVSWMDPCVLLCDESPDVILKSYLSPLAYLAGKPYSAPLADVWGLGCLLYTMLTGHTPFPQRGGQHALNYFGRDYCNMEHDKPIFDLNMPALKILVLRCLAYHPADRIRLNEIFDNAWFRSGFKFQHLLSVVPVTAEEQNANTLQQLQDKLAEANEAKKKKQEAKENAENETEQVESYKQAIKDFQQAVAREKEASVKNAEAIDSLLKSFPDGNNDDSPLKTEEKFKNDIKAIVKANFESTEPEKIITFEILGLGTADNALKSLRSLLFSNEGLLARTYKETGVLIDHSASDVTYEDKRFIEVARYYSFSVAKKKAPATPTSDEEVRSNILHMVLETYSDVDAGTNQPHLCLRLKKNIGSNTLMRKFLLSVFSHSPNFFRHCRIVTQPATTTTSQN